MPRHPGNAEGVIRDLEVSPNGLIGARTAIIGTGIPDGATAPSRDLEVKPNGLNKMCRSPALWATKSGGTNKQSRHPGRAKDAIRDREGKPNGSNKP